MASYIGQRSSQAAIKAVRTGGRWSRAIRTGRIDGTVPSVSSFGENDSETTESDLNRSPERKILKNLRLKMPVDMAMQEPGTGIVGLESDGNVVTSGTDVDDITTRGVGVVVDVGASAANDIEDVTVQVKRVTTTDDTTRHAEFDGSVARQ